MHDTAYTWAMLFEAFPGYELVRDGLRDLRENRETVAALLVLLAPPDFGKLDLRFLRQVSAIRSTDCTSFSRMMIPILRIRGTTR